MNETISKVVETRQNLTPRAKQIKHRPWTMYFDKTAWLYDLKSSLDSIVCLFLGVLGRVNSEVILRP